VHLLVYSAVGIGALLLLDPALRGRCPDLGGDPGLAIWLALACAALMMLYRTFSRPGRSGEQEAEAVVFGRDRRQLAWEAAVSLGLQVVLPIVLLAALSRSQVLLLFAPGREIVTAAVVVLSCGAATVVWPPDRSPEHTRGSVVRDALRAFPYLVVRAGFTEEVLFRGCLQTAVVRQHGALSGIALTVAVFSAGHVVHVVRLRRSGVLEAVPWGAVATSLLTKVVPAALLLGLLWHSSGNLWACVLLHGWIDALYLRTAYAQASAAHQADGI